MNAQVWAGLAATSVALAVPLLMAALGEVIAEKAGVINVGIEGLMLIGAFVGWLTATLTHCLWLASAAACGAGIGLSLIFALVCLVFEADQVVAGTAINLLALGITGVFFRAAQAFLPARTAPVLLPAISAPLLAKIPVIGHAFFSQTALGYFAFLMVPICAFFLNKTRAGLRLRAVGEHPTAARSAGASVRLIRLSAIAFGGAMAGLAGAYLSIAYTFGFEQGMSGGKGFIALAVVIVGRWTPFGALVAALLFGFASALQFQFQATRLAIPYQALLALPYLLTLLALVVRAGRARAPRALGLLGEG